MTIPKRGSRRIVVDDLPYRWRLRRRPTPDQRSGRTPLLIAVSAEEGEGPTMVAHLQRRHPRNEQAQRSQAVTPAEVARLIREARRLGWAPLRPGKQFHLEPQISGDPDRPAAPRIFPAGLRPPSLRELEQLAADRAPEERDIIRRADRPYISWPGGGGYQPCGLEVNGVDLIELVREAELPHARREVEERLAGGDSAEIKAEDLAGNYLGFPTVSLRGRALYDAPASYACYFGVSADDPSLGKATLLGCTCGITECWFLLVRITILDEVVIWSDFEQFHRSWIYDLGPFIFDKEDYVRTLVEET